MYTADGGEQQSPAAHTAEQGMPLSPCVPVPHRFPHTQAPLPKPHSRSQIKYPALPHRGHSDPRSNTQHCSAPLLASPCPTSSFPTSLRGVSTLPSSTLFTGPRNRQDNTLRPIFFNVVSSPSTMNFAHPHPWYILCVLYVPSIPDQQHWGQWPCACAQPRNNPATT